MMLSAISRRHQIMYIMGLALHRPIQHFSLFRELVRPFALLATTRKKTAAAGKIIIAADSHSAALWSRSRAERVLYELWSSK
jgi:hypothetical protein